MAEKQEQKKKEKMFLTPSEVLSIWAFLDFTMMTKKKCSSSFLRIVDSPKGLDLIKLSHSSSSKLWLSFDLVCDIVQRKIREYLQ